MGDLIGWMISSAATWFERVLVTGYLVIQWWMRLPLIWMLLIAALFVVTVYQGHRQYHLHAHKIKGLRSKPRKDKDQL